MQQLNENEHPQDSIHRDDSSNDLSFDGSSKFETNLDGSSSFPSDDDSGDDDMESIDNQDGDNPFSIHSLPHPDELPRVAKKASGSKKKSGSKALQTFAGVAGNILEW